MLFKKQKVIFLHFPKTGGNSVQDALRLFTDDTITSETPRQDGFERFNVRNHEHQNLHKHSNLQDYYTALGDELFDYRIFSTIRNPWDRMVSSYFSPHKGRVRFSEKKFKRMLKVERNLYDFISLQSPNHGFGDSTPHVELLKFEELQHQFVFLQKALGLKDAKLPHRNASKRDHYRTYFNEETKEIVQSRFQFEIALGDYEF